MELIHVLALATWEWALYNWDALLTIAAVITVTGVVMHWTTVDNRPLPLVPNDSDQMKYDAFVMATDPELVQLAIDTDATIELTLPEDRPEWDGKDGQFAGYVKCEEALDERQGTRDSVKQLLAPYFIKDDDGIESKDYSIR